MKNNWHPVLAFLATCKLSSVQALAADLKSKLLLVVLAPALLLGGVGSASAAVITSVWTDGDSNWNNAGNWSPALVPSNNATNQFIPIINNGSTVTLDISPTVNALGIDFLAPPASSLFIGNGRFLTIAGGTLINGNVIGVNAPGTGTLVLGSGGSYFNAGTFLASGGGTFEVNGAGQTIDNSSGVIKALDGSRVTLFNGLRVSGGTLATAGTGIVTMSGSLVTLNGVTNTGTFVMPGNVGSSPSVLQFIGTNTNSGTMGIFGPGRAVIFPGTFNNTGTLLASGGGTLEVGIGGAINNTGTLQASGGGTLRLLNNASVMNAGTVSIASGSQLDIQGATYVQTAGVTNVNGVFSAAPTPVDIRGGTLSGTGTVIANVSNGGTVAPGNSPGSLFVFGNYTQTPSGILDIEIAGLTAGSGYDELRVIGNAFLAGTLDIELIDGFAPTADAFFDILVTGLFSPGSVLGRFDTVDLPSLSTGIWGVSYLNDRVRVTFTLVPVPEPSSMLLLSAGLGLLGIALRRRKKV